MRATCETCEWFVFDETQSMTFCEYYPENKKCAPTNRCGKWMARKDITSVKRDILKQINAIPENILFETLEYLENKWIKS